ncbi:hypothetical protein HYH03_007161 [Edaphochlamys debaryana]|uniref:Uncharacterized protein n=1 Tax=Edaphochlamys debaryana TaxID=47281 RepID=A0A835Y924_9CHLO|nr:hypothetical protein HYH03_007161 [Edaphochlamys debaryana]|eukprot:KAG2494645.1 hypothetical protein HYH03_007161 [Edaphochlamys debaryana]
MDDYGRGGDGGRGVRVKLFVKEEREPPKACDLEVPAGCDFQPLHDLVCDAVLGSASDRWTLVSEQKVPHLGPDGGGHIDIQQEWQSKEVSLFTHPADDCCPTAVGPEDLRGGADVYSLMLGNIAKRPIASSQSLDSWWHSHPPPGPPLLPMACGRLLAKLRAMPSPAAPAAAVARLVGEGLAGLRELASDRWYGNRLPTDLLEQGLLAALRWERHAPPGRPELLAEVLEAASAAAWALATYGGPRSAMVSAGAVAELAQALKRAAEWRALALERGEATSVRAAESQREATEAAVAALTEAAEKAAKTEAEEAEKSAGSPELEAAILAADAAAEEAARAPLPDGTPYNLADCYLPPDGQVSLATANRISYNCLGALAVLAVDSKARAACLAVSPKLDFFLTAATADFPTVAEGQHALDVEAWRRRQDRRTAADAVAAERIQRRREEKEARKARAEQEARERAEREAAEAAEAARLEEELAAEAERMAAEDPELAALMKSRKPPSKPVTPTPPAEASQAEGGEADGGEGGEADAEDDGPAAPTDPYPLPPVVAAEDLAIVHQVMAAEALYAMLGRERGVRRAFAAAGGVAALGALLRCPNQGVMCAAMSCLAAYGRDVGHDHTSGLDMLATAAPPPPPPAPPPAPSPGGGGGKRSILPPAAAPTPPQPKKDPAIENAGKVVSELIEIVPPVLEDLIGMYGDGDRHVGGVDAMEEAAAAAAASEAAAAADAAAGGTSVGGDAASGAYGHSEAGGSVRVPSPDPNQRGFRSSFSRTSAVSRATTTASPGTGAGISFSARNGPAAGGAGGADGTLPRGLSVLRRVTLNTVPSGMRGPQTSLSEPTPRTAGGLRGCFLPHSLSDMIEISATALWALVAAEHRSAEIRAAAEIAAEAEAVAAAAAAVAAAAAAAAAKATARTSFGGNSLDGADSSTLLGGVGGSSSGNVAAAPPPPAPPPPPAVPLRPVKQADVDAIKSGLSTERLKEIASLAVAAGKLVPTELDELLHPDADPDDAGGHYAAAASVTAYDSEYMAGGDMDDEEDDDAGGGGGGGARSVAGKSVTGRSVAARSVAGRSVAAKSVAARSVRAPSHTAARSTAATSYGAGGADGDGYGNGGNSGGGGAPVAPHSHMLGALHALLGSLVVAYGSNRLVRTEFASLLTGHATLRRLHVQKELFQEELQVLVNELEAARRQPGRFFFEEEEEAKREEVQKKIRDAERGMRRQLRALAAAEDGLQAAAEAAVRAVATTLALLPYAPAASAQAAAGVVLRVPDPLPYTLDFQLGHCHVLSAGVVQALAATLQPGAVDAAAAAAAQVQRNWEAETSVSAAADATAAAEAADASGASPEALAAATAAAALYQGPFRDLILGSGVMEVMLAATAARYGTASTAAAVAAAAGGTTGGGGGGGTASGGAPRSGAAASFSTSPNAAGIGGLLSRASRATSVSSGSQREAGGGGGSFTGNADRGEGGRAGSPPRDARHSGDALDVATHVLMQVTSAALMYLASTELPLKSQQLVSVMSYMRTACHHAASGPFLSAAVYSLSRHVDNRRGMVEGVVPPPPRKQHIFEEGAAGATLSAGLLWAKSTANAPKLNANGDPPPAANVSFTPGAAAAAAAAPPPTLGTEVWVEVLEALMKPVLARLRRPTPSQQRVSIADSVASTMGGFGPGLGNGALGLGAGVGPSGGGPVGAALAMGLGGTGGGGGGGGGMMPPLRSGRFLSMAAWLLLRQWLVDKVNPVNMISSAEGLFAPGGCSFWSVLFDVDTPLELSPEVLDALALLVEAAHACAAASASAAAAAAAAAHLAAAAVDPFHHTHHISFAPEHGTTGGGGFGGAGPYADGGGGRPAAPAVVAASGIAALRRLAVRCVWSLSSAHPAVAAALAERGSGVLALAAMRDTTAAADSELQALCSGYLLQLASRCAPLLPPLGGLDALAVALVSLVERALAAGGSWPSAPTANADPPGAGSSGSAAFGGAADGRGVDVPLLEAAVRGLAWIAGSGDEGRAAVVTARGVRRLVAVVRADNAALAAVRERRAAEGTPAWVRVEELICPLRAINGLPITVPAAQAASQAALQPSQPPSRPASAAATATPVAGTPPPSGHALSRNASRIPASAVAAAKAATPPPRPGTAVGGGARASPAGGRPASASPAASRRSPSPGLSGAAAAESPRPGGGGGHGEVDEDLLIQSRQSGDADVGLTALWGLLNLSGYAPAQTRICRHGLYTLMACVHGSADPARSAAARATLSNIHYHPGNATVLYKAELKLKYAALARLLEQEEAAKAAQEASLKRAAAVVMEDIRAKANGGARPGSAAPGGAGGGGGGGNSMRPSSAAANRPHSARPGSAHPRGAAAARRPGGVAAELARQQLGVLAAAARAAASGGESGAPSPTGFGAPSPMPLAPPSPAANAAPLAAGTRPGATDALMASLSAALAQTASGGVPSEGELPPGRSLLNVTRPGALMMPGGADGGSDSDGGGGGALDADVIAARLRFLTWMADPTAKAGIDAAVPMPPTPGAGGGEGGWMGGGGDDTAAAVAAAAAAGEDPNLLATLTSDPEERRWLDMVARMQREEAREEAKAAAGNFMRGVLSRSLAAGAHSLWKEQDDGSGGGGGGSTARGGGSGGANSRRQGSARRPSTGGAPGANAGGGGANRPRSASVGRGGSPLPAAGGGGGGPQRPGSALRGSAPSPMLAWPPAARAAAASTAGPSPPPASRAAASNAASSRFANLYGIHPGVPITPRGGRHPLKPVAARLPPSVSGGGGGGGSSAGGGGGPAATHSRRKGSAFSLTSNPWAPHILRYVSDPPSTGGPPARGELATRMLTAAAPEYVTEELAGLTERLMTMTTDRRRQEEADRAAAEAAAAAAVEEEQAEEARRRLGVSKSGRLLAVLPIAKEASQLSHDGFGFDFGAGGGGGGFSAGEALTKDGVGLLAEGSAGGGGNDGPGSMRSGLGSKLMGFGSASMSGKTGFFAALDNALGRPSPREGEPGSGGASVRPEGSLAGGVSAVGSVAGGGGGGGGSVRGERSGASAAAAAVVEEPLDPEDEPVEPRSIQLLVSLLPPVLLGPAGAGAGPAYDAEDADTASDGGGGAPSVIPAPASVIAGGGALTAVPSTYLPGAANGAAAAASLLSASQAPSGLPHDSAASLVSTTSYDTISTVDPSLAAALQNPAEAYRKPRLGLAAPPGTLVSRLRSAKPDSSVLAVAAANAASVAAANAAAAAVMSSGRGAASAGSVAAAAAAAPSSGGKAGKVPGGSSKGAALSALAASGQTTTFVDDALAKGEPLMPISDSVPRPVTVLAGSVADLLAAKQAREADAANRLLRATTTTVGDDSEAGPASPSALASARTPRAGRSFSGTGAPPLRSSLSMVGPGGAKLAAAVGGGGGGGSPGDGGGGGAAADEEDPATEMLKPQPLSVLVATGDGGTDRLYRFPRLLLPGAQHMCLFEHVDGCRFCEALYGHYLLPNGTLAHFYLGDTVVKGHRVDLSPAPAIPFAPADWVSDGLPACGALADWGAATPGRLSHYHAAHTHHPPSAAPHAAGGGGEDGAGRGERGVLLAALWCPVPLTAAPVPPERRSALEWGVGEAGEPRLEMRSLALEVRLTAVRRTDVRQEIVVPPPAPTTKGRKKKAGGKPGAAAGKSPGRR